MKKLNRKGFTLIELLAVIVILAIILVVTIPSVLASLAQARENSLQNATDSVADWFTKEYELAAIGDFGGGADQAYKDFINGKDITKSDAPLTLTAAVLTVAGISNADKNIDLDNSSVYYNASKQRMCVTLKAKSTGSFYNNTDDTKNTKTSSGC